MTYTVTAVDVVCAAFVIVLGLGILALLWDELRRPKEPSKRAVNQERFRRLHVVDREPEDAA